VFSPTIAQLNAEGYGATGGGAAAGAAAIVSAVTTTGC
jgi:hypothetical protein